MTAKLNSKTQMEPSKPAKLPFTYIFYIERGREHALYSTVYGRGWLHVIEWKKNKKSWSDLGAGLACRATDAG